MEEDGIEEDSMEQDEISNDDEDGFSEADSSFDDASESEEEDNFSDEDCDVDEDVSLIESESIGLDLPLQMNCASHTLHLVATTDLLASLKASKPLHTLHTRAVGRCTEIWEKMRYPKNEKL